MKFRSEHREKCVNAINQFLQDHLVPIAVCSRITEYESLSTRLKLHGAVLLQPLTTQQIDAYLDRAGPALSIVRTALQQDVQLSELAKSPLMLSIMALAYQGMSRSELALGEATPTRRQHLYDAYLQRMFVRREVEPVYSPQQTLRWLKWLSVRLVQHGQSIFLIERMQPNWLQWGNRSDLDPYYMLIAGPACGLAIGLMIAPIVGLINGLIFGSILGLIVGLMDGLDGRFKRIKPLEQSSALKSRLRSSLYASLYWGLMSGSVVWLSRGPTIGLISALIFGMIWRSRWRLYKAAADGTSPQVVAKTKE